MLTLQPQTTRIMSINNNNNISFSTTCAAIKSTPKSHELFRGPRTPCRAQGISCKCQLIYKSLKKQHRVRVLLEGESANAE